MTDKLREAAQLLPCPFCGGKPAIGNNRHTVTKEGRHIQEILKWETWINCPHCQFAISSGCIDVASRGNAIAHQETLERATQMWNTRAPLAQQDAQACVGCNGIGMVGNILDTVTCPFCDGSGNAAPTPPAQLDDERLLRLLLAVRVAGVHLYADDGEMSDCSEQPHIDFKRDSVKDIERKLIERGMRKAWSSIAEHVTPTQPAPKPLGWLDRKAVECLQGAELNWMPAWNRPTSSDPVPIFLSPTAQRVMLTDEEISLIYTEQTGAAIEDSPWALCDFARAVIDAYERKNGISQPGYTAPDMASQGASQFRAGHDAAQSEIAELEQENRLLRARNDRLQKEIEQKGER